MREDHRLLQGIRVLAAPTWTKGFGHSGHYRGAASGLRVGGAAVKGSIYRKWIRNLLSAQATQETSPPDSCPAEPTTVNIPMDMRSLATTLLAILAVIFALRWAQDILVPFVIGILISYALSPLVTWMNRLKIPRPVGSALLLTATHCGSRHVKLSLG